MYVLIIYYRKINQYSPSENVKVYEKAVSRRHAPQFDPKATIAQLHDSDDEHELDERGRRRLVDDYLEVLYCILLEIYFIFIKFYAVFTIFQSNLTKMR